MVNAECSTSSATNRHILLEGANTRVIEVVAWLDPQGSDVVIVLNVGGVCVWRDCFRNLGAEGFDARAANLRHGSLASEMSNV